MNNMKYYYYAAYSQLKYDNQQQYYQRLTVFLRKLVFEYPQFAGWFEGLFDSGFQLKPSREIILCEAEHVLAGVAILKKDKNEKKICTLRVDRGYRNNGIGKQLMQLSFEWLESEKPIITLHKSKYGQFESLLQYFDFNLEQKNRGYYHLFNTELVFNGILPEKNIVCREIELAETEHIIYQLLHHGTVSKGRILECCVSNWRSQEVWLA